MHGHVNVRNYRGSVFISLNQTFGKDLYFTVTWAEMYKVHKNLEQSMTFSVIDNLGDVV